MSGLPPASTSGFGMRVGERPQPLAAAGGEDHRLHAGCSSSSSRASGASSRYLLETETA